MSMVVDDWVPGPNKAHDLLHDLIEELMNMDVPVIAGAGNYARQAARTNVDTVPAYWAGSDYPLIVVGSTQHGGARSDFSQTGLKVTLHAPGDLVTCMLSSGTSPATTKSGTSYATSTVAGQW